MPQNTARPLQTHPDPASVFGVTRGRAPAGLDDQQVPSPC